MHEEILGVLCSGRGTNLQSIIAAVESGQIRARIGLVLTDKPEALALQRAEKAGIVETREGLDGGYPGNAGAVRAWLWSRSMIRFHVAHFVSL